MKACPRCEQAKPFEEFVPNQHRHDGLSDPRVLAIDHRNGGGGVQRRAGLKQAKLYRYVLSHVDEFQLLCHNCNWIKRLEEDVIRLKVTETVTAG